LQGDGSAEWRHRAARLHRPALVIDRITAAFNKKGGKRVLVASHDPSRLGHARSCKGAARPAAAQHRGVALGKNLPVRACVNPRPTPKQELALAKIGQLDEDVALHGDAYWVGQVIDREPGPAEGNPDPGHVHHGKCRLNPKGHEKPVWPG
jgi:hypothetical protein